MAKFLEVCESMDSYVECLTYLLDDGRQVTVCPGRRGQTWDLQSFRAAACIPSGQPDGPFGPEVIAELVRDFPDSLVIAELADPGKFS